MYYTPQTADGRNVDNSLSIKALKLNFIWPLRSEASRREKVLLTVLVCLELLFYSHSIFGQAVFIFNHHKELDKLTDCLITSLIGLQFALRIFYHFMRSKSFKRLLEWFYKDIYISEEENVLVHRKCIRTIRLVYLLTPCYIVPLMAVLALPIREAFHRPDNKPFFWLMEFPYDAQKLENYIWTQVVSLWVGISCVSMMTAEDGLVCTVLHFCATRFRLLQADLDDLFAASLTEAHSISAPERTVDIFTRNLIRIIQKHQIVDRFSKFAENYLQFTIFSIVYFQMLVLCMVAYQMERQSELNAVFVKFVVWLFTASAEILFIGCFGQEFTDESSKMSDSYYMCNWEKILPHGDAKSNVKLLKMLKFAIARSQKPVYLTGLKFATLSKATVAWALKTSLSLYMFIHTVGDGPELVAE